MKTSLASVSVLATLGVVAFLGAPRRSPTHLPTVTTNAQGEKLMAHLPVAFVPNLGQWEHSARYVTRIGAMTVFLEEKGWTFTLVERAGAKENEEESAGRGVAVRMTFAGAGQPVLRAEDRLPGRHNYFLGNDPSKWRSDVPLYGAVCYREIRRGVDVRAREQDGHFEYDLMLEPGADLEAVEITVEGIERMYIDADGALVMDTQLGPVRMPAPLTWEEGPSGERSLVTCRYVLRGENRFGFEVAGRRPGWALTVDPGLVWSTLLGGMREDTVQALALDAQGAVTVAGYTGSTDFPTTPGAFDTTINVIATSYDAFVTKLSPTGSSLAYSTFLGGTSRNQAYALALDAQGAATVAGFTFSPDFPTTAGAFDTSFNGNSDGFVARLSANGSSLVYSTFLGGADLDQINAVVVDLLGAATVAGMTRSSDFPTTPGAFGTSYGRNGDGFVTQLSPTGSSLHYSTYLGGTVTDIANDVALDAQGAAIVVGQTSSADFPTTPGAFDRTFHGTSPLSDAFVTKLSPTGSSLVYSTFLGGTGHEAARTLAVDARGTVAVAGRTNSADFPTTPGAFDTVHNGNEDIFIARLSATGSSLVYSTFLGGPGTEAATAIAVDEQGAATISGATTSTGFPTTSGAFATTHSGAPNDAFVCRLSPTGARLVYSTFLGEGSATSLAVDSRGAATVAGSTGSSSFPTTPGAFDTSYNGSTDAFVTRLDMLPTGVAAFGRSSPGCAGPLAISVTSMPQVGNGSFALTCGNAPPSTTGALALAASGLTTPIQLLGIEVWLDPSSSFFVSFPAGSDAVGACAFALPIPNHPSVIGKQLAAQFLWAGPTSPPPCPPLGLSTSHALDITIQP